MTNWELLNELVLCETNEEIEGVLKKIPNQKWVPINNDPGNYITINNLNSSPIRAIAELIKNSEDHILIKLCLEHGIDPKSNDAPKSPEEACEKFLHVPQGDMSLLALEDRKKLGNNRTNCFFTGHSKEDPPSIWVTDNGEGQNAADFPNTFLSLTKSNKKNIKFVLGEFGQGSHSVNRFCTYRLIISRRDPNIGGDDLYGFTVVKRISPADNEEHSWWGYLTIGGKIPQTPKLEDLLILPDASSNAYSSNFEYGTALKMYQYDLMPKSLRTNASINFHYEVGKYFGRVFVPYRIWETRPEFIPLANTNFKNAYGLQSLHSTTAKESGKVSEGYPRKVTLELGKYGKASAFITCFEYSKLYKKATNTATASLYHPKSEPIIFTINGQHHGAISLDFFDRKEIGMSLLRDVLFIDIDLTSIPTRYLEDILMTNRERLVKDKDLYKVLEDRLTYFLVNDPDLRFQLKRRYSEIIRENTGHIQKDLKQSLKDLILKNPILSKLFAKSLGKTIEGTEDIDSPVVDPPPPPPKKPQKPFNGNNDATFLIPQADIIDCPINKTRLIVFHTDLNNGNFKKVGISYENGIIGKSSSLHNGKIYCGVEVSKDLKKEYYEEEKLLLAAEAIADKKIEELQAKKPSRSKNCPAQEVPNV